MEERIQQLSQVIQLSLEMIHILYYVDLTNFQSFLFSMLVLAVLIHPFVDYATEHYLLQDIYVEFYLRSSETEHYQLEV